MGVVVYGLLIFGYGQFYRELGVRPDEVGINYAGSLGGAAGLTIVIVGVALVIAAGIIGVSRAVGSNLPKGQRSALRIVRTGGVLVTLVGGFVGVLLFTAAADRQADLLKHGHWLEPLRIGDMEILSVRADPVEITPIDDFSQNAAIFEATDGHALFFLGAADGLAVIYDSTDQSVWRVPTESVALRTENCETTLTDAAVCAP